MHSLPVFLKLAGQPVILIGEGDAAEAKRRLIERAGGMPVGEDDPDARLAFVALEKEADARAAAARLKARALLVNVVDRPDLCDFTTPAIVDRDPVIIAVGTGGASAGLAKAVRQRIEALLPPGLGALAQKLDQARAAIRARWPEAAARRHALDAGLAPGGVLDPLRSSGDELEDWLADGARPLTERSEMITLTSPHPDDLTLRAARLLGEADRIVHPPETPPAILARARADAVRLVLPPGAAAPSATGLTVRIVITSK